MGDLRGPTTMLDKLKQFQQWLKADFSEEEFQKRLQELREQAHVPVFWLIGKSQSGKTSIIKYLTGAEEAEIGRGFQPCTKFSRLYHFPTEQAPLVTFLDTRGLEEPSYDPAEDIARFDHLGHVMLVTVKATDHALENMTMHVRRLHLQRPQRPMLLALTCLHEAYPQQQHPVSEDVFLKPDWAHDEVLAAKAPNLLRTLIEQRNRFTGLINDVVPLDLTPPEEGFDVPEFGGQHLKDALLKSLPEAYRQTLIQLEESTGSLQDLYARRALPHIMGFSSLAATAGAIPIPWVDLLIVPGIQTRMIYHLAKLYGQPLEGQRFLELAGTLGLGMLMRQAAREVVKFIPWVGSVAGAALAGSATFALGKAFCYYYQSVHKGHVPRADELKQHYQQELARAETLWKQGKKPG